MFLGFLRKLEQSEKTIAHIGEQADFMEEDHQGLNYWSTCWKAGAAKNHFNHKRKIICMSSTSQSKPQHEEWSRVDGWMDVIVSKTCE